MRSMTGERDGVEVGRRRDAAGRRAVDPAHAVDQDQHALGAEVAKVGLDRAGADAAAVGREAEVTARVELAVDRAARRGQLLQDVAHRGEPRALEVLAVELEHRRLLVERIGADARAGHHDHLALGLAGVEVGDVALGRGGRRGLRGSRLRCGLRGCRLGRCGLRRLGRCGLRRRGLRGRGLRRRRLRWCRLRGLCPRQSAGPGKKRRQASAQWSATPDAIPFHGVPAFRHGPPLAGGQYRGNRGAHQENQRTSRVQSLTIWRTGTHLGAGAATQIRSLGRRAEKDGLDLAGGDLEDEPAVQSAGHEL